MYGSIPATVFRDGTPQELNEEQEKLKREIYDRMNPRRRKFVEMCIRDSPKRGQIHPGIVCHGQHVRSATPAALNVAMSL